MKARPKGLRVDAMPESAGSNYAVQKTLHECCAATLCTNGWDNRKEFRHVPWVFERLME